MRYQHIRALRNNTRVVSKRQTLLDSVTTLVTKNKRITELSVTVMLHETETIFLGNNCSKNAVNS